jgi:hypothetical protein
VAIVFLSGGERHEGVTARGGHCHCFLKTYVFLWNWDSEELREEKVAKMGNQGETFDSRASSRVRSLVMKTRDTWTKAATRIGAHT